MVYSSSSYVDDLALAAAWSCMQGVAADCAEATTQVDAALANTAISKAVVSSRSLTNNRA